MLVSSCFLSGRDALRVSRDLGKNTAQDGRAARTRALAEEEGRFVARAGALSLARAVTRQSERSDLKSRSRGSRARTHPGYTQLFSLLPRRLTAFSERTDLRSGGARARVVATRALKRVLL